MRAGLLARKQKVIHAPDASEGVINAGGDTGAEHGRQREAFASSDMKFALNDIDPLLGADGVHDRRPTTASIALFSVAVVKGFVTKLLSWNCLPRWISVLSPLPVTRMKPIRWVGLYSRRPFSRARPSRPGMYMSEMTRWTGCAIKAFKAWAPSLAIVTCLRPIWSSASVTSARLTLVSSTTMTCSLSASAMTCPSRLEFRRQRKDLRGDLGKRRLSFDRADFVCHSGHAVDDRGRFVLPDRAGAGLAHRQEPRRAVAAHAGQDHAERVGATGLGDRVEQRVDRRPVAVDRFAHLKAAPRRPRPANFEMSHAPRSDMNLARSHERAILGLRNASRAHSVEARGERSRERRGKVDRD